MQAGVVKGLNNQRSFGFIQPDDGDDVFIHICAVGRTGMASNASVSSGAAVIWTEMADAEEARMHSLRPSPYVKT